MTDPLRSPLEPTPGGAPTGDPGWPLSTPDAGVALLHVRGEIDALNSELLESSVSELLDRPAVRYVIDLDGVTFLASSGLAVLIRAAHRIEQRDIRLRLVATGRAVRRPLEVTGSAQLFDIFPDRQAAVGDSV